MHQTDILYLYATWLPYTERFTNTEKKMLGRKYRMRINYRRISLLHNLSRKCRKIVKFVSITRSERNVWNGPIVATAISREKRKLLLEGTGCFTYRA